MITNKYTASSNTSVFLNLHIIQISIFFFYSIKILILIVVSTTIACVNSMLTGYTTSRCNWR